MIAGAGFAKMAWELAKSRTRPPHRPFPHRVAAAQSCNGADSEYFRKLDNAWRGHLGLRAAAKLNMLGDRPTVTL